MKKNKKILLLDTSISTENIGDYIIMDAVRKEITGIFPDSFLSTAATHDTVGPMAKYVQNSSDFSFIGGTNLLSGVYKGKKRMQWKLGILDSKYFTNLIGVGLGWSGYKDYSGIKYIPFVYLQKKLYQKLFSQQYLTSVRDSFTEKKLSEYGVKSINTACVTMWGLTQEHLSKIKKEKSSSAVLTITDYCNGPKYLESYRDMINITLNNYENVFLWLQSPKDLEILNKLKLNKRDKIKIIPPQLNAYNKLLDDVKIDYIGTRLHGGIRALQRGRRTLIVEVDNRATEIAKDTNLPTLSYEKIELLDNWINKKQSMDIQVPFDNILKWKSQFLSD